MKSLNGVLLRICTVTASALAPLSSSISTTCACPI
jgi:hypothetical protein